MDDVDSLSAVIARQRACRTFSERPVDEAVLMRILDAARWAPSAHNSQPWEWVVVRDAATRAAIGGIATRLWEQVDAEWRAQHVDPRLDRDVERGVLELAAAPVLIVVCGDTSRCDRRSLASSVFPAVQNLLLAATEAGLGSALTTLATYDVALGELLGLPEGVVPLAVVPVGHPARGLGPPRRDPTDAHLHRERW